MTDSRVTPQLFESRRARKKRERIERNRRVLANGGYLQGQGAIAEVLGVRTKDIRRLFKREGGGRRG